MSTSWSVGTKVEVREALLRFYRMHKIARTNKRDLARYNEYRLTARSALRLARALREPVTRHRKCTVTTNSTDASVTTPSGANFGYDADKAAEFYKWLVKWGWIE